MTSGGGRRRGQRPGGGRAGAGRRDESPRPRAAARVDAARTMGAATPLDEAHPATPRGFPTGLEVSTTLIAEAPFADLDAELPLLLLPVRIETRYRKDAEPPELLIRIYPDQLHIDTRPPGPGPVEADLTRQFWRTQLRAGGGPEHDATRRAAWRTFVRRVGPARAGDLARRLRPLSVTPAGPVFPELDPPQAHETGAARPASAAMARGRLLG